MSIKTSEILSDVLGIENHKQVEVMEPAKGIAVIKQETSSELNEDQEADYTLARSTFRDLINKGNMAMENLTDLAKESESPRAYEVLSTMMKTIADTTKDLYDLQKKTKDLKAKDEKRPQDEGRINVEKAVFVGSTSELLKKIKEEKNEDF